MTRFHLVLAGLAVLASAGIAQTAPGPSPSDLYHRGAHQFVDGDQAGALAAVDAGLAQAPGDARLQALRDLIQKQQEEQDDQDGGQQDQDAQNSEAGDQGQQGDDGESGQGQEDQSPQDDSPSQNGPEAERDQTDTAPPQSAAPGQAPPQAGQAGEMTATQADRILDAVGGEERLLLREIRRAPTQRRRSDKDW